MRRIGIALLALGLAAGSFNCPQAAEDVIPLGAAAKEKDPKGAEAEKELAKARQQFGWQALMDLKDGKYQKVANFLLLILGAAALGAILAYHPFASRRASVEELEQPKIIITYTVVGALIAIIVAPIPQMAFAIFGIGGLMRFRTELGAAKETGRVILATVLGLSCGLEFWTVAILGTMIAWILLFILESQVNLRLVVRGVRSDTISQSAEAYAKILRALKCSFAAPRKNPSKGQVSFNIQHKRGLTHEEIEGKCNAEISKELRGTIDWPEE